MIDQLKEVLEVLKCLGIEEAVIEPGDDEDSPNQVRAVSKDGNIVVCGPLADSTQITEQRMGIQSVSGLLSRIDLFDLTAAKVEMSTDDHCVTDLFLKQGRKKATFRFANPDVILAPKNTFDRTPSDPIVLQTSYVQGLGKAIAAMSFTGNKDERTISIKGDGERLNIRISDGEDDTFEDSVEIEIETDKGVWEVAPFYRVMTRSAEYAGDAVFVIDDYGVATFDLKILEAMVVPMAS